MKRLLAILLAGVLAMSLAACGKKGDVEGDTKEPVNEQTNAGDSEDYPVLRINQTAFYGGPPDNHEIVEEALNKILREKAHAEVEVVYIQASDLQTQLNLLLTGGDDALDILTSFWYTSIGELVSNGQVMAIDDVLESSGPGIQKLYETYPEILDCARVDGKLYGIPSYTAWTCGNMYLCMEDTAKAANVEFPERIDTVDELTDILLKLKEANPDKYFIAGSTSPYWIPKSIDYLGDTNYCGVIIDPENSTKIENFYESDYFMNFCENVKKWKENDLICPDPMSNTQVTLGNLTNKITYGITGYDYNLTNTIYEANKENTYDGPIVGTEIGARLLTTSNVTTYLWHITSFCDEPEAAMRVLDVLYTDPEAANIFMNGVEGVTYVVDENGQLDWPEGIHNHQEAGWFAGYNYSHPNGFLCPTWSKQRQDAYELMKQDNANGVPSKALGFTCDISPVADQYAACANVIAQYYLPIINGVVDIDETLPEFQKALRDAGIEDIVAEKQAQLDRWLAGK